MMNYIILTMETTYKFSKDKKITLILQFNNYAFIHNNYKIVIKMGYNYLNILKIVIKLLIKNNYMIIMMHLMHIKISIKK